MADHIDWSDNAVWAQAMFDPPALARDWFVGSSLAAITPSFAESLLTNERGEISRAVIISPTRLYAVKWQMYGTLSESNTKITFDDGSVWIAAHSANDPLFGNGFSILIPT